MTAREPDDGKGKGRRRWGWKRIALCGLALLVVGVLAYEDVRRPPIPAHIYTETRTELVWEGETVVIDGTVHCERSTSISPEGELWPGFMSDSMPRTYDCSPEWLAKRLPDGSVLLVGAFGVSSKWGGYFDYAPVHMAEHREHIAKVPRAVIWLDAPVNPTRGEYYFSSAALDDPRSRLSAITTGVVSVSRKSVLSNLPAGRLASNPAEVVPWLAGHQLERRTRLMAVYAFEVPKRLWSRVEGLEAILAQYREPAFFRPWSDTTDKQRVALSKIVSWGNELIHPMMWTPEEVATFTWAGRISSKYYLRSRLVRPLVAGADGVFRPSDAYPKGALAFTEKPQSIPPPPVTIAFGPEGEIAKKSPMGRGESLYDPASEQLLFYEFTFF